MEMGAGVGTSQAAARGARGPSVERGGLVRLRRVLLAGQVARGSLAPVVVVVVVLVDHLGLELRDGVELLELRGAEAGERPEDGALDLGDLRGLDGVDEAVLRLRRHRLELQGRVLLAEGGPRGALVACRLRRGLPRDGHIQSRGCRHGVVQHCRLGRPCRRASGSLALCPFWRRAALLGVGLHGLRRGGRVHLLVLGGTDGIREIELELPLGHQLVPVPVDLAPHLVGLLGAEPQALQQAGELVPSQRAVPIAVVLSEDLLGRGEALGCGVVSTASSGFEVIERLSVGLGGPTQRSG
mmetsp:Transcript_3560/g.9960  ORF Transcript_3560/g.9960 Transcript_3560/m.9960 type:complete len:298 (+) Transcript_3560:18-911(+)